MTDNQSLEFIYKLYINIYLVHILVHKYLVNNSLAALDDGRYKSGSADRGQTGCN